MSRVPLMARNCFRSDICPQAAEAAHVFASLAARLKSCPDGESLNISGMDGVVVAEGRRGLGRVRWTAQAPKRLDKAESLAERSSAPTRHECGGSHPTAMPLLKPNRADALLPRSDTHRSRQDADRTKEAKARGNSTARGRRSAPTIPSASALG